MLYSDSDFSNFEIDYEKDKIPNIKNKNKVKPRRARKEIMVPRLAAAYNIQM